MLFNDVEYTLLDELYRSKGSLDQRFVEKDDECVEDRRKFYVLQDPKTERKFWIKQYTGEMGDLHYEHKTTRKHVRPFAVNDTGICRAVRCLDIDLKIDALSFEYLEGFNKIDEFTPEMLELIKMWFRLHRVRHYDLCPNNTMIGDWNGKMQIVLIDFEPSLDRNAMKDLGL